MLTKCPFEPVRCVCRVQGGMRAIDAESASIRRESAAQRLRWLSKAGVGFYPERMLELSGIDVEEIATALADQTDYEHRWLIDPRTGQVAFWTSDTGIDGQNPVELDELDLILIDPLPPYVWFQDMADFAEGVSNIDAGRDLTQSLKGRGAFRRFKNQLSDGAAGLVRSPRRVPAAPFPARQRQPPSPHA